MLVKVHPVNPQSQRISLITEMLEQDGVVVIPTDSVYALCCDIRSKKGFDKMCQLRRIQPEKATFSIIVSDLSQASEYIAQLPNSTFRIIKRNSPGPFTFILRAGRDLPAFLKKGRKTIGVRLPDNAITTSLVTVLGRPVITTSLRSDDEILEYYNDPVEIEAEIGSRVDCVIDAGPGTLYPSTIVDCTGSEPVIIREGRGELEF